MVHQIKDWDSNALFKVVISSSFLPSSKFGSARKNNQQITQQIMINQELASSRLPASSAPARNTDGSHCSCRCCTPSRQRGCCAGRAAAGSGERDDDDASWKTVFFSLQWPADGCCLLHPGTPAVWLELKNPAIKHTTDGTFSIFHPALIKQPNNI